MADFTLANHAASLAVSPVDGVSAAPAVAPVGSSIDQFQHLLDAATVAQSPLAQVNVADANARARHALDLDGSGASGSSGDVILGGLQKIRGVFDQQQAKLQGAMATSGADPGKLYAAQMEIMNYSVLIDLTSKLTGKSTQAFETLLKG